jgi:hypothetical protein
MTGHVHVWGNGLRSEDARAAAHNVEAGRTFE